MSYLHTHYLCCYFSLFVPNKHKANLTIQQASNTVTYLNHHIVFAHSQGTIQGLGNGGKGPVNQLPGPIPLPVGQVGQPGPRGPEGLRGEYVSIMLVCR